MFTTMEHIPENEIKSRQEKVRKNLESTFPSCSGILIFSRVSIYYLTGTLGMGVLWLPLQGDPVLMMRKGIERAELESTGVKLCSFRSYGELPALASESGSPFGTVLGVEQGGLSWDMGLNLTQRLKDFSLIPADSSIKKSRSIKSKFELETMLRSGAMHSAAFENILPKCLAGGRWNGLSERDISIMLWDIFFSLGHDGMMRMSAPAEEIFLGHITTGENGNYPSYYNGPLGNKGTHPASPYMGSMDKLEKNSFLAIDAGFSWHGYNTDKTQLYFTGKESDLPVEALKGHELAMKIQQEIASSLVPGAIPEELYRLSLELAKNAGLSEYYMGIGGNKVPFLGHSIGLCIDEWPVIANGFREPLAENMVFALEPKIGIPGMAMVGVENTFIVTPDGGVNITGGYGNIICLE